MCTSAAPGKNESIGGGGRIIGATFPTRIKYLQIVPGDRPRHATTLETKPSIMVDRGHRRGFDQQWVSGLWWTKRWHADLVSQSVSAYSQRDFSRADSLARQRLREAPADALALRQAARAAARQDRDQNAITIYSRLELRLMTAEDYFLLGRALSRSGQDDSALKSLEAARAADPDRPEMLDELARVYSRKGLPAATAETALRLAQKPGWEPIGQLMLGTARAVQNDPAAAAQALRRAFELDPDGKAAAPYPAGPLKMLFVQTLLKTGQPAEARRYLQSLPQSDRGPEAAWLLSRCFLQEKSWEPAAAALEDSGSYRAENPSVPEPGLYVGAARCGQCHSSISKSMLATRHAQTFSRPHDPRALSLPDKPLADPGDPTVLHTFQTAEGGIRVETRVGQQVFHALAAYAFGSPDHYVTLVGPDAQGAVRMLRISSYHSKRGSGLDLSSGLEPHPADPAEFLGHPLIPSDGVRRCLTCHTTNFRSIELGTGPESADHAIGCEACHGPGGNHLLAVEAGLSESAIASPRGASARTVNQVCERCHRMAHVEEVTAPPDDPAWLRFQTTTMYRSQCYSASGEQLHCVTCHDPHKNAEKSPAVYESKCLTCHAPPTATCPVNPSRGCIECHMPKVWVLATHSLKSDHNIRVHKAAGGS